MSVCSRVAFARAGSLVSVRVGAGAGAGMGTGTHMQAGMHTRIREGGVRVQ